jgi:hypothetical protein
MMRFFAVAQNDKINNFMKTSLATFALLFCTIAIALPALASAASNPPNSAIWNPSILKGPLVTCIGASSQTLSGSFVGPLQLPVCENLCDLISTVLNVIYFVIAFVIWIAAPISVAVGGIMYMFAGANPAMVTKAKTILLGVVWGIAIVLCSYVLVSTFVKVLNITGIGGFGTAACSVQ